MMVGEKRTSRRYAEEIVVDFNPSESKVSGVTRDVSQGGMFVRTSRMPDEGQRLLVTLRFADGRQLLLQGDVVRTFEAPSLVRHLFPTGFGIAIRNSRSYERFVASVAAEKPGIPSEKPRARESR